MRTILFVTALAATAAVAADEESPAEGARRVPDIVVVGPGEQSTPATEKALARKPTRSVFIPRKRNANEDVRLDDKAKKLGKAEDDASYKRGERLGESLGKRSVASTMTHTTPGRTTPMNESNMEPRQLGTQAGGDVLGSRPTSVELGSRRSDGTMRYIEPPGVSPYR